MQDDDIHVDLPSQLATENYGDQFSDSSYQIASIELARITGNTTREIYTRPKSKDSFLQREQKLLIELKEWVKSLPEHLRLHPGKLNSKHTVLMHLQFSYCVTLGLRPVLLHLIKRSYAHRMEDMRDETAPVLETLSEACIHAARYSLKLCIEEWTSGSLAIFGYAFPAFIFSSSLVLVASNLLTAGDQSDAASVETAAEMLQILSTSHNLAAKDFHEHLQSVREHLRRYQSDIKNASGDSNTGFALQKRAGSIPPPAHERTLLSSPNLPFEDNPTDGLPPGGYSIHDFTTEMVLESALMQEFLTQSTSEVESLNPSGMSDAFDAAFFWPYDSGLLDS
ncbi:fungal-specific transcription factor domain-containing protein [Penicillium chermesinum]|uniref:Fungal-specific transcription factor domain-containing protein n=1 Tax=Penicillium chermesinum TaxID=63820 RepID=A0A9W9PJF4_9EURO|nr:fungal-specific transcription factor domain-containing protein [Penicillium chermesinum]KAJ5246808.1 fungal-specific transcription factor domain-containing protein [Penicillium chermesinum]